MGRSPCCDKTKVKKGPWSPQEDVLLRNFVFKFGNGGNWISLPKKAGLNRCGKSCRLRWLNYLRPNIKHGDFTDEEDRVIYTLYHTVGSRWSVIAASLPGRTDNDVKNYWNTKLRRKISAGKFKDVPLNDSNSNNYTFSSIFDSQHLELGVGAKSSRFEQHQLTIQPRKKDNFVMKEDDQCHDLSCSTSSSVNTEAISSQNSGSSIISNEDEFWMELFSESFDHVTVGSQLVEDKISEIASLLDDFC